MKIIIGNLIAAALAYGLAGAEVRAADTTSWVVNKHQQFNQTSSGAPVLQSQAGGPYTFEVEAHANAPGPVLGLSLKLPNGTIQLPPTNSPSNGYGFGMTPSFATLAALDAAYPAGQYALTITNANDGIKRVTNTLPASVYPNPPHVSNYDAAQKINPLADFTLAWDAFAGGTAGDLIELQISDASGNTIISTPLNFGPGTLTGLSNSVVIPANTLSVGQTYSAQLWFYKVINVDTTSYPGATGYTLFWERTTFNLQAGNPFGAFPIATNGSILELWTGGTAASGSNYLVGLNQNSSNVCLQLMSANGGVLGPLLTVGASKGEPRLAFGKTNYLAFWGDDYISGAVDLYGQLVSSGGAANGPAFPLLPSPGAHNFQAERAIVFDGTNYLVVWQDGGPNYTIYGQLVTASGALSGSQIVIASSPVGDVKAAMASGATNSLFVWQDEIDNDVTRGAFISRSGAVSGPLQISQTNSPRHNPLSVAFDGTNYLVIWNRDTGLGYPTPPNFNIDGRLVSPNGTLVGNEFTLVTNSAIYPSLAFDGTDYLLNWIWVSQTNLANQFPLYYQFLNRSASPAGPAFTVFQQGTNNFGFGGLIFGGNKFMTTATLGSAGYDTNGSPTNFYSAGVYGAFIPSSTASPTVTATGPPAGAQFPLQLAGTPGINYAIQYSTNLISPNWAAWVTNSPTNGPFSFMDTHATNKSRFYRALKQ